MAKKLKHESLDYEVEGIYFDWFLEDKPGMNGRYQAIRKLGKGILQTDKDLFEMKAELDSEYIKWRSSIDKDRESFIDKMGHGRLIDKESRESLIKIFLRIQWENTEEIKRRRESERFWRERCNDLEEKIRKEFDGPILATLLTGNYSRIITQMGDAVKVKKASKKNLDSGRHLGPQTGKKKATDALKGIQDYANALFDDTNQTNNGRGWKMSDDDIITEMRNKGIHQLRQMKSTKTKTTKPYKETTFRMYVRKAIASAKEQYK